MAKAAIEPPAKVGTRSSDRSNMGCATRRSAAMNPASAAAIHWHESTVRRRIDELRQVFRDTRHLYAYLTGELAALPGVSSVQTAPIIGTLKRAGSVPSRTPRA